MLDPEAPIPFKESFREEASEIVQRAVQIPYAFQRSKFLLWNLWTSDTRAFSPQDGFDLSVLNLVFTDNP
jgi:hypothetical protein